MLANNTESYQKKQLSKGISLIVLVPVCLNLSAYLHAMLTQSPKAWKGSHFPKVSSSESRFEESQPLLSMLEDAGGPAITPAGHVPWEDVTSVPAPLWRYPTLSILGLPISAPHEGA